MIVDAVWTSCCLKLSKRSEEHTSELQSQSNLVCRLLLEKKKTLSLLFLQCPSHSACSATSSSSASFADVYSLHISSVSFSCHCLSAFSYLPPLTLHSVSV